MAKRFRPASIEDLHSELILLILSCGRLSGVDLVRLELTSRLFSQRIYPHPFRTLVDFVASQLCMSHPIYAPMSISLKGKLFDRCGGNWKQVLCFLQAVQQSSSIAETSSGKMQVTTGSYHTLLIRNSSAYSCGSNLSGVLGFGAETTQCVSFAQITFPFRLRVSQVSASHNHAAFVMESGEVFTCGNNSSYCCGHGGTTRTIFEPRRVEALRDVPCQEVAAGLNFTVFLSRGGHMYTCGENSSGQLGHGDTLERPTPEMVEHFAAVCRVAQIAAGPRYVLAVTANGGVYSFGSGSNFCLGHGNQHNEFQPHQIHTFRRQGIHVVRVSAGDEHAVALDSDGFVYTWGKGYCGALGHGDEIDKRTPQLIVRLKDHLAVQVCARKSKTFVLIENGDVFGFGWMCFGSLGFPYRGGSDKVLRPRILNSLEAQRIAQISTGLYHTVVVTRKGQMFGFGNNEKAQLGHDMLRGCLEPTEISLPPITELLLSPPT